MHPLIEELLTPVDHLTAETSAVDVGGFEAMITVPELSWCHVGHPCQVVSVGQAITATILDVDPVRERVSLSLTDLHDDPVPLLAAKIGQTVLGRVTELVPFGAFVRVEEADRTFAGLVHDSDLFAGRTDDLRRSIQVGQALRVAIVDVDPVERRTTLSRRHAAPQS
ncbi:S1 RNA-binding domain-containing protein [Umezawaea beigongshangensis]|uniref:S1 RNA-binding domain-containing protein n=1 Tax=Umezawaea beigongshangensis TaxID=2780383 RepID=UPI0018F19026|nr:S1 RNA-binding domain-containing protein [Umezawaea beigongshangensis]